MDIGSLTLQPPTWPVAPTVMQLVLSSAGAHQNLLANHGVMHLLFIESMACA